MLGAKDKQKQLDEYNRLKADVSVLSKQQVNLSKSIKALKKEFDGLAGNIEKAKVEAEKIINKAKSESEKLKKDADFLISNALSRESQATENLKKSELVLADLDNRKKKLDEGFALLENRSEKQKASALADDAKLSNKMREVQEAKDSAIKSINEGNQLKKELEAKEVSLNERESLILKEEQKLAEKEVKIKEKEALAESELLKVRESRDEAEALAESLKEKESEVSRLLKDAAKKKSEADDFFETYEQKKKELESLHLQIEAREDNAKYKETEVKALEVRVNRKIRQNNLEKEIANA